VYAQPSQRFEDHCRFIGHEEQQVAGLQFQAGFKRLEPFGREEFGEGRA
jgi:hypothetical protein